MEAKMMASFNFNDNLLLRQAERQLEAIHERRMSEEQEEEDAKKELDMKEIELDLSVHKTVKACFKCDQEIPCILMQEMDYPSLECPNSALDVNEKPEFEIVKITALKIK
jgi:hypothetical protein